MTQTTMTQQVGHDEVNHTPTDPQFPETQSDPHQFESFPAIKASHGQTWPYPCSQAFPQESNGTFGDMGPASALESSAWPSLTSIACHGSATRSSNQRESQTESCSNHCYPSPSPQPTPPHFPMQKVHANDDVAFEKAHHIASLAPARNAHRLAHNIVVNVAQVFAKQDLGDQQQGPTLSQHCTESNGTKQGGLGGLSSPRSPSGWTVCRSTKACWKCGKIGHQARDCKN